MKIWRNKKTKEMRNSRKLNINQNREEKTK